MTNLFELALLGLGTGAIYALAAQGIVLIYRGSGVINFAHGAMALLGAAIFVELRHDMGLPTIVAMIVGIAATALVGLLVDIGIMRRIRHASPLARLVATLGVLGVVEGIVIIRYGSSLRFVDQYLPAGAVNLPGGIAVGLDRLVLCAIAGLVTLGLWALYQKSDFGRQTSAVAEDVTAAAALGVSAERVSAVNCMLGGAMAGLAGILLIPLTGLMPPVLVLMIIPMLAAALIGGFSSFPRTFAAGMAIGVAQSLIAGSALGTGTATTLPFLVIIAVMVLQGRSLPMRGYATDRLPAVSLPRPPGWLALTCVIAAVALILLGSEDLVNGITGSLIAGCVLLSIVLLTGLAGQVSLGQFAFAGLGAFVSARLAATTGLSFPVAFLAGIAAAVPLGLLFGLPALRTRGINLAVVTLGLGVALDALVFKNKDLTGGFEGTRVDPPELLGIELDSIFYPERYALLALAVFVLLALMVVNIRRGATGRRMLAVRANERAAAALGIGVTGVKLYAFSVAAGIAAAGGALKAFRYPNVRFDVGYSMFDSIPAVLMAFLGGIGFVLGAVIGGLLAIGGVVNDLLSGIVDMGEWQGLVIGASAIIMVIVHPDGIAPALNGLARRLRPGSKEKAAVPAIQSRPVDVPVKPVAPQQLVLDEVTVRFGGLTALDAVSFAVSPGEVLGLIGPNGAGKTSLIDAVTGFVTPQGGHVLLGDHDIGGHSAARRARMGIGRSFQNLELFEDLSVADNVRVACDPAGAVSYALDPVLPRKLPLPGAAQRALELFGLAQSLDKMPEELSYGERRLLAIARTIASEPSVLLLDEPAAGLAVDERARLTTLIRRLADEWGMAVLLVEHDMNLVMQTCDRLVVLDFGRRIAIGTPQEVSRQQEVIDAYLGSAAEPAEASA
jgi:ABC-type branched-subunit amino acid transport system ATPase component/branched-subunit amino acid ABC-type transport system permease component